MHKNNAVLFRSVLFRSLSVCVCTVLLFLQGCALQPFESTSNENTSKNQSVFLTKNDGTLLQTFSPLFIIENETKNYNLIGTPTAHIKENKSEHVFVDPEKETLYAETRHFTTADKRYTNLIYRVHFEKTPGGFFPYYLGKGKNVGHIIIVTLNNQNQPILYTSVHSCGCYLAFVPTSYMDQESFAKDWDSGRQEVYSENLPGLLDFKNSHPEEAKVTFLIRDATHRVGDIWLSDHDSSQQYNQVIMELQPLELLERLPLQNGETTSFYETSGLRKGYVKASYKPRERLLMSWWALDWRVGEDKKLGRDLNDSVVFYTSLKPWAREASDLRNFPAFLKYWGWNL